MFERRFAHPAGFCPTIFLGMSPSGPSAVSCAVLRHLGRHDRQRARVCGPGAQRAGARHRPVPAPPPRPGPQSPSARPGSVLTRAVKLWLILAGAVVGDDQNCIEHWVPRSVGSNFRTGCVFTRGSPSLCKVQAVVVGQVDRNLDRGCRGAQLELTRPFPASSLGASLEVGMDNEFQTRASLISVHFV